MQLKNSQEQTASEIQASEADFFLKDGTINVNVNERLIKVFGRKKDTIDVVNRIYCSLTSSQSKNIICVNSNKGTGLTLFGHLLENVLKEYLDADDIYFISYNHNNHTQNTTSQNKINKFNQKMKTFQQDVEMGKNIKTKSVVIKILYWY